MSVNPAQFGPDSPSISVHVVTAGWPGNKVDKALNSHEKYVSDTGRNSNPPGSDVMDWKPMLACICSRALPSVGCGNSVRNVVVSSLLVTQVVALSRPVTGMLPDQTYQSGQAMKMVGNGLVVIISFKLVVRLPAV